MQFFKDILPIVIISVLFIPINIISRSKKNKNDINIFYDQKNSSIFLFYALIQGTWNICDWIHCENGGTCQQTKSSLLGCECRCPFGFTGLFCENSFNVTSKKIVVCSFNLYNYTISL